MRLAGTTGILVAAILACAGCSKPRTPERRLETEASEIARFIAGYGRFDALHLADSVDLYIAPDGGGGHARIAREGLRDPHAWQVKSGDTVRSFVPRGLRTSLITDVGHYMNCNPSELRTRFPALAAKPHVGVRLEPPQTKSCLDTWNATFVFDTTGGQPRLVAAIYDQWEW